MIDSIWLGDGDGGDSDQDSADADYEFADRSFEAVHTPTSGSDDEQPQFGLRADRDHSSDDTSGDGSGPRRKPGGYDSRIEQILYENPNLSILITDAGKSVESGGRYIVYTIKTGVSFRAESSHLGLCADHPDRISKCDADTLSLPHCAML